MPSKIYDSKPLRLYQVERPGLSHQGVPYQLLDDGVGAGDKVLALWTFSCNEIWSLSDPMDTGYVARKELISSTAAIRSKTSFVLTGGEEEWDFADSVLYFLNQQNSERYVRCKAVENPAVLTIRKVGTGPWAIAAESREEAAIGPSSGEPEQWEYNVL